MWVDGLTHSTQDAQAAAVMLRHKLVAMLHQAADQGGCGVQHTHLQDTAAAAAAAGGMQSQTAAFALQNTN
jgi:hypothetical protein